LDGNPSVWADLLGYQLGGELSEEERDEEDDVAMVVVCLVRVSLVSVIGSRGVIWED